jgi:hypothetical protein
MFLATRLQPHHADLDLLALDSLVARMFAEANGV